MSHVYTRKMMKLTKIALFGYGVMRKVPQLSDASMEYRIRDTEHVQVPLLPMQKAVIACMAGCMSIWMFPYYIYEDVKRTEHLLRGIPPPAPRFPKTMLIDFVFE